FGMRDIRAAFSELAIPVIGAPNRVPGVAALNVSLAGRYEHYSDFGSAWTPRVGVLWSPLQNVSLRAAYSEAFRPPGLLDLNESNNAFAAYELRDPQALSGVSEALIWAGKNRDLREETSKSWSTGFEIESLTHPGAALALTLFRTDFTNRLNYPT